MGKNSIRNYEGCCCQVQFFPSIGVFVTQQSVTETILLGGEALGH